MPSENGITFERYYKITGDAPDRTSQPEVEERQCVSEQDIHRRCAAGMERNMIEISKSSPLF
jgi:hypothetical protein